MKVEGSLFIGCAVFFGVVDIVYWHFSKDPTGTTALFLSVCLAFLTGFYLLFTGRRLPPRAEDVPDAEISDGTGELGFFSPHSWWPLITGLPDRDALRPALGDRVRLRVLPRAVRALSRPAAPAPAAPAGPASPGRCAPEPACSSWCLTSVGAPGGLAWRRPPNLSEISGPSPAVSAFAADPGSPSVR